MVMSCCDVVGRFSTSTVFGNCLLCRVLCYVDNCGSLAGCVCLVLEGVPFISNQFGNNSALMSHVHAFSRR